MSDLKCDKVCSTDVFFTPFKISEFKFTFVSQLTRIHKRHIYTTLT